MQSPIADILTSRPVHVIAAGKAAAAMASAFLALRHLQVQQALAIGTHTHPDLPTSIEWIESSHPFPDARSQAAGERAIALAQRRAFGRCARDSAVGRRLGA